MKNAAFLRDFLWAWLIAGFLDITGAILVLSQGYVKATFQFITAGVLGPGHGLSLPAVYATGLLIHFLIAFCWSLAFFLLYKPLQLYKIPILLSVLLYGTLIYLSMRYLFVPLMGQLPAPKSLFHTPLDSIVKNILILSVAFGLTLNYFARRNFRANHEGAGQ